MGYIPHTEDDVKAMLAAIGVDSLDALFEDVPSQHRFPTLNLPEPLSELEIATTMETLSWFNLTTSHYATFLGAGAYNHYSPAIVNQLLLRGEFYSAYTPYQPEVSQGTLQATFEFQSMIAHLTGMEAANASHYDGATALAEAVTMANAIHNGKRQKVILSPTIHPQYREVVRTYHQNKPFKFSGDRSGTATLLDITDMVDENTMLVAVQYPNFLGQIEDFNELARVTKTHGALLCVVADPVALSILKPPGEFGADIVVGEGQGLGIPMSFGGPYLGFFATNSKYVRRIAGRIVGETRDLEGQRAFVMTLRPREQDIRREKATSNICTNQGLMALAACIHMAALGKHGMKRVGELCWHKAHYAADQIDALEGYSVDRSLPFFKEFVVTCPRPVNEINQSLLDDYGIIGGYDLSLDYPHRGNQMLLCVTETNPRAEIDMLVKALREIAEAS
ncbi:MAG: aminomethyl-transferring glycine dehydrogenase [Phototrophicales bacterium]|nr:MAG: aminomethyl-transferring glycine dehydrogenase [Phototrophicales bacterium]